MLNCWINTVKDALVCKRVNNYVPGSLLVSVSQFVVEAT